MSVFQTHNFLNGTEIMLRKMMMTLLHSLNIIKYNDTARCQKNCQVSCPLVNSSCLFEGYNLIKQGGGGQLRNASVSNRQRLSGSVVWNKWNLHNEWSLKLICTFWHFFKNNLSDKSCSGIPYGDFVFVYVYDRITHFCFNVFRFFLYLSNHFIRELMFLGWFFFMSWQGIGLAHTHWYEIFFWWDKTGLLLWVSVWRIQNAVCSIGL